MNKTKIIIIVLILVIVASIGASIYMLSNKDNKNEYKIDGIDAITDKEVIKDAKVEVLSISEVSITIQNEISSYSAKVLNTSNEDYHINKLYLTLYDGNIVHSKILALTDITLKPNEYQYINITAEDDLTSITSIKYTLEDKTKVE